MWINAAASAACRSCACVVVVCLSTGGPSLARAAEPLTMDAALARIVREHPALQALDLERSALEAAVEKAAQRPALTASVEAENVLGTGDRSAVHGAEWTLSLEGVLERGGKRALRELLAARRVDAQAPRRAAAALDLLAEGALRYLDVVEAEAEIALSTEEVRERGRWASLARERLRVGAIPATSPLVAEAKLARAQFELQRAQSRRDVAWRRLAALWGERGGEIGTVAAVDPLALPEPPALESMMALLARNPELTRFAADERLRTAQLRLAEAARAPDLTWRAGVRRLEEGDDWALVAGVSVPLGSRGRAAPDERAARAELDALAFEREGSERQLRALLVDALALYASAHAEVRALRDELLPRYDEAAAAAERAWRAGALSPLEGAELLDERLAARRTQLAAAIAARRALIEIQRLTAEPLQRLPAAGESR